MKITEVKRKNFDMIKNFVIARSRKSKLIQEKIQLQIVLQQPGLIL